MPQFSLKQLILASTFVAVGVGLIAIDRQLGWGIDFARDGSLWLAGSMLIGAGIMTPFNRKLLGALLGPLFLVLAVVAFFFYLLSSSHFHS